jgi:hypothetical protein
MTDRQPRLLCPVCFNAPCAPNERRCADCALAHPGSRTAPTMPAAQQSALDTDECRQP